MFLGDVSSLNVERPGKHVIRFCVDEGYLCFMSAKKSDFEIQNERSRFFLLMGFDMKNETKISTVYCYYSGLIAANCNYFLYGNL